MCQRLYIASREPLRPLKKTKHEPYLDVRPLGDVGTRVRLHFRKEFEHVYVAGAHVLCGCGFPEHPSGELDKPLKIAHEDRLTMRRLHQYLQQNVGKLPRVQLYLCWWGDEDEKPRHERAVRLGELTDPLFRFKRMEILSVRRDSVEQGIAPVVRKDARG